MKRKLTVLSFVLVAFAITSDVINAQTDSFFSYGIDSEQRSADYLTFNNVTHSPENAGDASIGSGVFLLGMLAIGKGVKEYRDKSGDK